MSLTSSWPSLNSSCQVDINKMFGIPLPTISAAVAILLLLAGSGFFLTGIPAPRLCQIAARTLRSSWRSAQRSCSHSWCGAQAKAILFAGGLHIFRAPHPFEENRTFPLLTLYLLLERRRLQADVTYLEERVNGRRLPHDHRCSASPDLPMSSPSHQYDVGKARPREAL